VIGAALQPTASVALAVYGAIAATLSLGDNSSISARSPVQGRETEAPVDMDTTPYCGLSLRFTPNFDLSVGYSPRLTLYSAFDSPRRSTSLFHQAYLSTGYGGARYRITLSQSVGIGTQNYARLYFTPTDPNARVDPTAPRVDFIPPGSDTVQVINETTSVGFNYQWSRFLSTALNAGYGINGGTGSAQAVVPRQRIATAGISVGTQISTSDNLSTTLGVMNTRTTARPPMEDANYLGFSLSEHWTHRFSPTMGLGLGVGALLVRDTSQPDSKFRLSFFPTSQATLDIALWRQAGYALTLTVGASMLPTVMALSSQLQLRMQGTATLTMAIGRDTSITATFDGAQTLPLDDPRAARLLGGGLAVNQRIFSLLSANAGVRVAEQHLGGYFVTVMQQPPIGQSQLDYTYWYAFVGFTVSAPPIRF
jgi:hypothetical protein